MNNTYLVPFFLGIFSGFLATLPVGPAKILAVRKFLLISKGKEDEVSIANSSNTILLASISGLIFAHLLFFLSLQFPFLYSLWVKPHFFSVFFILVLFIYLYQIKNIQFDVYNTQSLLNSNSNVSFQRAAFLETLFLQLLNPVLLPNPVFFRLTDVFLFRYSTVFPFFAGNFLGLFSGYGTFFLSTLFLLKKLELDAPTIYRLLKIKIHQFFVIVLFVFSLLCLSRTPLPSIGHFQVKSLPTRSSLNKFWYDQFWPDSFFSPDTGKRPLRLISFENNKTQPTDEIKPFNKMFFSQFFFESCLKDGKYSLFHNFPQSLSSISQNINFLLKNSQNSSQSQSFVYQEDNSFVNEWLQEKKGYQTQLQHDIDNKIDEIERGNSLEEIIEKKFSSIDENKNKIAKQVDPRLSIDNLGVKLFLENRSFLFLTKEYFSKKNSLFSLEKKRLLNNYTTNKLKLFLTENSQNFSPSGLQESNIPFLPWKPLSKEADFINSVNEETKKESNENVVEKTRIWEKVFQNLSNSENSEIGRIVKNFERQKKQEDNLNLVEEENSKNLVQLYKSLSCWNLNFSKEDFDIIKRKSRSTPDLNVFFPKSVLLKDRQNFVPPDKPIFRRNEVPGTTISRRGKAVFCNLFEKKPHAPFFLTQLKFLKNYFAGRKKIEINQDVPFRSQQSKSRLFSFLRDYLLSAQAYLRKYLKLPFLIIVKNITRQFLFQNPEWEKDWTDLSKEVYIECDLYGKPISIGVKLPNFFYIGETKQIKILNPFQLRFWTRSIPKEESLQELEQYSFLNAWGRETKVPFGPVKKIPSFLQLLIERIKLLLKYKFLKNLSLSNKNQVVQENQSSEKKLEKNIQSKIQLKEIETKSIKIEKESSFSSPSFQNSPNSHETKKATVKSPTTIPIKFSTKQKMVRRRKWTNKNFVLLLQKKFFEIYRFYLRKQKELFYCFQIMKISVKKFFLQQNTKITKTFIQVFSTIYQFMRLLSAELSEVFGFSIIGNKEVKKSIPSNLNKIEKSGNKKLSQAYIIHSLWEDTLINKPEITSLIEKWDQKHPLKRKLETFLQKQGILGNDKPETLTEQQWKEWLKNFRGYTPSLKLWALWAPSFWTKSVEKYWKEVPSSKLTQILNKDVFSIDFINTDRSSQFLELHLPLFQSAQKQKKVWKFNSLSRNYTELSNDINQNSFLIWQTNDFDKKTQYLSDILKKVKIKEKNLLLNPTKFSLLQIQENISKPNLVEKNIKKELPTIQREKKRLSLDIKVDTLQQRTTFSPILTRRWKLKKLKNKLEKLAKTVIKKPKGSGLSSSFFISQNNKKAIKELFESENRLFANNLENWNTKILDDELLMYNTLSSVLRFANKNTLIPKLNTLDSLCLFSQTKSKDFYFVLLDDIYLPTHLREIRILDCLNFNGENQTSEEGIDLIRSSKDSKEFNLNKKESNAYNFLMSKWNMLLETNQNTIEDGQKITRFLWPRHRLEDLSCINRVWTGTANQSRFGILRLQNYPNL